MKPGMGQKQTEVDSRIRCITKASIPRKWERLEHPAGSDTKKVAPTDGVPAVNSRKGLTEWCGQG